jgi:hypothetical protein
VGGLVGEGLKLRYCNSLGASAASSNNLGKKADEADKNVDEYNDNSKHREDDNGNDKGKLDKGGSGKGKGGGAIDPGFDTWWGDEGPLVPSSKNGDKPHQIWSIAIAPKFSDTSEHRVAIAERRYGVEDSSKTPLYFAQAEFYFDCAGEWTALHCNGAEDKNDDNAGYSIQWRARLRRTQFPEQLGSIAGALGGALASAANAIEQVLDIAEPILSSGLGSSLRGTFGQMNSAVDNLNQASSVLNQIDQGAYH